MPTRVFVLLLPESMLSTVTGPLDVLSAAGTVWPLMIGREPRPQFSVELVGLDRGPLSYAGGMTFSPTRTVSDPGIGDVVYAPSLSILPDGALPASVAQVSPWLRRQHDGGALVCSACTGTYILASAGLLDEMPATTHWAFAQDFHKRFPKVKLRPEAVLVPNEEHRLVTAGASTSWHDLMYFLMAKLSSSAIADEVRSLFLIDGHDATQGAYSRSTLKLTTEDREVGRAQQWLQAHIAEPRPVEQVVAQTSLAERTLKRRFQKHVGTSIMEYVKELRVNAAKEMLVNTATPIDEISRTIGYQDASFFRRTFLAKTGLTPSRFRDKFRCVTASP